MKGSLYGKYAGVFVSTGNQGGGQEATVQSVLSTLTHHGVLFVPLGYAKAPQLTNLSEVRGGMCFLFVSLMDGLMDWFVCLSVRITLGRWDVHGRRWFPPTYRFGTRARECPRKDLLGDRI